MENIFFFRIGPLAISFKNDTKNGFLFFADKIQGIKQNTQLDEIDIVISIADNPGNFPEKYYSSGIKFSEDSIYKIENTFDFVVDHLFDDQPVKITVYPKINIKKFKYRILNLLLQVIKNRSIKDRVMEEFFSYKVFWSIFGLALLKRGMAFIHGGSLAFNYNGVLFIGTGGCGKTSTSFTLLEDSRYKYLSEDFGIIDIYGNIYFNSKWMAIYNSDIKYGQKDLKEYKKKRMTFYKRGLWKLYDKLGINPMVRIAPSDLFGEKRIAEKSQLKKIYFFARMNINEVKTEKINLDDFIERSLNATFRELKPLYEILIHPQAVALHMHSFPTLEQIRDKYKKIYHACFAGLEPVLVNFPLKINPVLIIEKLGLEYRKDYDKSRA